jgi:hypothetical protein
LIPLNIQQKRKTEKQQMEPFLLLFTFDKSDIVCIAEVHSSSQAEVTKVVV